MKKALFFIVSITVLAFFVPHHDANIQKTNQAAETTPSQIDHPIYPPI
jgi:amino acid permease